MKFLLLLILLSSISSYSAEVDSVIGIRYATLINNSSRTLSHIFLEQNLSKESALKIGNIEFDLKTSLRALYDPIDRNDEFQFTSAYFENSGERYFIRVGAQQFAFSETFGVNLMDILNPRDYRLSIFDDAQFYRLSVWSINYKFIGEQNFFQVIITPVPRKSIFPSLDSSFEIYLPAVGTINQGDEYTLDQAEGALRFGRLFDSGVDISFIAATHQNRIPAYKYYSSSQIIEIQHKRVNSFGTSVTYSKDAFVLRGDLLLTHNDIMNNILGSVVTVKNHIQSILGVDWTGDQGLQLGAQLHYDSHNSSEKKQKWISILASKSWSNETYKLECMAFRGISNNDLWISPKLIVSVGDFQFKLIFDFIDGKTNDGGLALFKDADQVRTQFNYFF